MTAELPKRITENIEQLTERTWLLPKIPEWWDHSDERIFLLSGGPGTGKSMVLAWLAGSGSETGGRVGP
jgi:Mrp family chromosome partitioning ATPase